MMTDALVMMTTMVMMMTIDADDNMMILMCAGFLYSRGCVPVRLCVCHKNDDLITGQMITMTMIWPKAQSKTRSYAPKCTQPMIQSRLVVMWSGSPTAMNVSGKWVGEPAKE